MNREIELLRPTEIQTWKIKCLKCGKKFDSQDKKRNRICDPCSAANRWHSHKIYKVVYDFDT